MEEPMSMGNVATFLTKLWALVDDESYDDLICWSEVRFRYSKWKVLLIILIYQREILL
jgi:hypothetical protein